MARKKIPVDVQVKVLTQAGYRCAVPTCRTILALDLHHIVELGKGGSDDPDNLVALCPTCHALHHRGTIPIESIRAWKMLLFSINEVMGKRAIDNLLLLEKQPSDQMIMFTGDSLIEFAPVIAAKLVEWGDLSITTGYSSSGGSVSRFHCMELTPKGHDFLAAWRAGQLDEAQKLVSITLGVNPSA